MRYIIGNEASRFDFLRDSDRLSENELAIYRTLVKINDTGQFCVDRNILIDSLKLLSALLAKHYGKRVILLEI